MESSIAGRISQVLSPLIGEVLTRVSLELESKRLGKTPETLAAEDLDEFAHNLEQQLRLVVGPEVAAKAAERVGDLQSA
ncbi:MAG: hypothetical protein C4521_01345 [Actinobacteria bacterium]|nr:MAG: hypothetical protein C4521_01345 [Actinomycetota bacterium]